MADKKFCRACGKPYEVGGQQFCRHCGAAVDGSKGSQLTPVVSLPSSPAPITSAQPVVEQPQRPPQERKTQCSNCHKWFTPEQFANHHVVECATCEWRKCFDGEPPKNWRCKRCIDADERERERDMKFAFREADRERKQWDRDERIRRERLEAQERKQTERSARQAQRRRRNEPGY